MAAAGMHREDFLESQLMSRDGDAIRLAALISALRREVSHVTTELSVETERLEVQRAQQEEQIRALQAQVQGMVKANEDLQGALSAKTGELDAARGAQRALMIGGGDGGGAGPDFSRQSLGGGMRGSVDQRIRSSSYRGSTTATETSQGAMPGVENVGMDRQSRGSVPSLGASRVIMEADAESSVSEASFGGHLSGRRPPPQPQPTTGAATSLRPPSGLTTAPLQSSELPPMSSEEDMTPAGAQAQDGMPRGPPPSRPPSMARAGGGPPPSRPSSVADAGGQQPPPQNNSPSKPARSQPPARPPSAAKPAVAASSAPPAAAKGASAPPPMPSGPLAKVTGAPSKPMPTDLLGALRNPDSSGGLKRVPEAEKKDASGPALPEGGGGAGGGAPPSAAGALGGGINAHMQGALAKRFANAGAGSHMSAAVSETEWDIGSP